MSLSEEEIRLREGLPGALVKQSHIQYADGLENCLFLAHSSSSICKARSEVLKLDKYTFNFIVEALWVSNAFLSPDRK